jgi:hypothetical protein
MVKTIVIEQSLKWLLRLTGVALLMALIFVFCPYTWLQKGHTYMGMDTLHYTDPNQVEPVTLGEMPYTPLLSYLTRTLSAMYAIVGAIAFYLAYDVKRYLMLVRLLGCIAILGGIGVTILDAVLGLPWLWTALEGPMTIVLGAVLIGLAGALYTRETG